MNKLILRIIGAILLLAALSAASISTFRSGNLAQAVSPSNSSTVLQQEPQAEAPQAPTDLLQASGKLTLLRVHELGSGYGPPTDSIDVEVVIWLDSQPGKAFGFQLRDDAKRPAHQGMLDLLRDAFNNNWTVTIDYNITPGLNNGVIIRVWLTK